MGNQLGYREIAMTKSSKFYWKFISTLENKDLLEKENERAYSSVEFWT